MEIVNGQVQQTTSVPLETYLQRKKDELERLSQQVTSLTIRQTKIIAELEGLVEEI